MPHKESRPPRSRIRIVSLTSRKGTAVYRLVRLWEGFGKPGGKLEASARAVGARGQNFYMLFGVTNRFLVDLATFPDHAGAKSRMSFPQYNDYMVPGVQFATRRRAQKQVPRVEALQAAPQRSVAWRS